MPQGFPAVIEYNPPMQLISTYALHFKKAIADIKAWSVHASNQ